LTKGKTTQKDKMNQQKKTKAVGKIQGKIETDGKITILCKGGRRDSAGVCHSKKSG